MSITETENRATGAVSGKGANGASAEPREKPRLRLEYLDGLRGLAALYVVFFHAYFEMNWRFDGGGLPKWALRGVAWMTQGHYAVAVFIVLSGYCLMLPVARSADGQLRGGFWSYIQRRARRILPPYYAALALSLLVIAIVPDMNVKRGANWDWALPAFTPGVLLSHLLLYHNLSGDWAGKINPPMWSVATEWQIYFLFPLLLLPAWKKGGLPALVGVGFAVGIGLYLASHRALEWAAPWYLGLFAFGMAGAVLNFSTQPRLCALRERLPWGALSALCTGVFFWVAISHPEWLTRTMGMDIVVGAATTCAIVYCTRSLARQEARRPMLLRLLEAPCIVALGTFSYSLYLIHAPLLAMLHMFLQTFWLSPLLLFGGLLFLGVPLSVGLAYLFHLAFERRFMPGHPRTERQAAKSAALSPAP